MFGMSFTEILIILVLALVLLGPQKLPEVAKSLGKGLREFNKFKDGLTSTLEQELYKEEAPPQILRARHLPTPPAAAGPITSAAAVEALARAVPEHAAAAADPPLHAGETPVAVAGDAPEPGSERQLSLLAPLPPPPKA